MPPDAGAVAWTEGLLEGLVAPAEGETWPAAAAEVGDCALGVDGEDGALAVGEEGACAAAEVGPLDLFGGEDTAFGAADAVGLVDPALGTLLTADVGGVAALVVGPPAACVAALEGGLETALATPEVCKGAAPPVDLPPVGTTTAEESGFVGAMALKGCPATDVAPFPARFSTGASSTGSFSTGNANVEAAAAARSRRRDELFIVEYFDGYVLLVCFVLGSVF